MPDVRLAATGMDSCPASDEDTEDELESARRTSNATRLQLLPSTSRQLVRNSESVFSSPQINLKNPEFNSVIQIFKYVTCIFLQVGESNRPSFRPGLEGGSSDDDESSNVRDGPPLSGIEHRRSAEGQVINPLVTGAV